MAMELVLLWCGIEKVDSGKFCCEEIHQGPILPDDLNDLDFVYSRSLKLSEQSGPGSFSLKM
jgi:hypothetical protein